MEFRFSSMEILIYEEPRGSSSNEIDCPNKQTEALKLLHNSSKSFVHENKYRPFDSIIFELCVTGISSNRICRKIHSGSSSFQSLVNEEGCESLTSEIGYPTKQTEVLDLSHVPSKSFWP